MCPNSRLLLDYYYHLRQLRSLCVAEIQTKKILFPYLILVISRVCSGQRLQFREQRVCESLHGPAPMPLLTERAFDFEASAKNPGIDFKPVMRWGARTSHWPYGITGQAQNLSRTTDLIQLTKIIETYFTR